MGKTIAEALREEGARRGKAAGILEPRRERSASVAATIQSACRRPSRRRSSSTGLASIFRDWLDCDRHPNKITIFPSVEDAVRAG